MSRPQRDLTLTAAAIRHLLTISTSPPRLPNDDVRLLFTCVICEAPDRTTIRMNYIYGEAELTCHACSTLWICPIVLGHTQLMVYIWWLQMIYEYTRPARRHHIRRRRHHSGEVCVNCGIVHAAGPGGRRVWVDGPDERELDALDAQRRREDAQRRRDRDFAAMERHLREDGLL